eukprot:1146796-Pelagomonas_calceolata.AAC.1
MAASAKQKEKQGATVAPNRNARHQNAACAKHSITCEGKGEMFRRFLGMCHRPCWSLCGERLCLICHTHPSQSYQPGVRADGVWGCLIGMQKGEQGEGALEV